jgi:hypothetical protein
VRFGELRDTSSADEDLAALRFAASLCTVFIYLLMGGATPRSATGTPWW